MIGIGLAVALTVTTGQVPLPAPEAVRALREARVVSMSSTCLSTRERIPGEPDSRIAYCDGGGLLTHSGPESRMLVMPDGHGYSAIPDDVLREVQSYLRAPVAWSALPGTFGWPGTFSHYARDRSAMTVPRLHAFASATVSPDGRTYRLHERRLSAIYVIDESGRLSSADWTYRSKGTRKRVIGYTSTYEGITIPSPTPEQVLPEAVVRPAIQTARAPKRMRLVVRVLMADGRGSVMELRVAAATLVRLENRGVGKHAGRLHIQSVRHGVRLYARNRYTSHVLEVRVLSHHGRWRTTRIA